MNNEIVSYEIANDLKELGFAEECFCSYGSDGELDSGSKENFNENYGYIISAPTYNHVADWLRKQSVFIDIKTIYNKEIEESRKFLPHPEYHFTAYVLTNGQWRELPMTFLEWEQAMSAAIQFSIKFLKCEKG